MINHYQDKKIERISIIDFDDKPDEYYLMQALLHTFETGNVSHLKHILDIYERNKINNSISSNNGYNLRSTNKRQRLSNH
jgi:hypothetical protein